jgi:hypothetical protein
MGFDYDGRRFRAVRNSASGEVGGETVFEYRQAGDLVWATYAGGSIRLGHLVALMSENGELEMRYHHVNAAGALQTGVCHSTPTVLPDGRYQLAETWQWTSGDRSAGTSLLEEILP